MGIILLEAADAREPLESAAVLVAVQHAEIGHADGQLAVAAQPVPKHQAVPCIHTPGTHSYYQLHEAPRRLPLHVLCCETPGPPNWCWGYVA